MSLISQEAVSLSQAWGATFGDYNYVRLDDSGTRTRMLDLQDLMVEISKNRAVKVEGEVKPLATRITNRNKTLDKLGLALADLTNLQAQFDSDAKGSDREGTLKQTSYETLQEVFGSLVDFGNLRMKKSEVEYWLQMVKSRIDSLNNVAEKDMTRLQSLVDRRDEAYSTASDLMSEVSDTRSNLIGNL
jgi:chromosome segregation ATPase